MRRQPYIPRSSYLAGLAVAVAVTTLSGCAAHRYMLDDPVNDPIMSTDDQQDSDLCKVEDGGFGGAGGECPT